MQNQSMYNLLHNYPKISVSSGSIARRRPVFGVGINDADFKTEIMSDDGRRLIDPAYTKWKAIFQRCFCDKYKSSKPTYSHCSISSEWVSFLRFRDWYLKNYVDGWHLDKDIKIPGNKIYGEEYCMMVPAEINSLLTNRKSTNHGLPIGVSMKESRFQASVCINGRKKYIGSYDTLEEAGAAYVIEKNNQIKIKAEKYPLIGVYLLQHLMLWPN